MRNSAERRGEAENEAPEWELREGDGDVIQVGDGSVLWHFPQHIRSDQDPEYITMKEKKIHR
jgi:hypothetical protein